MTKPIFDSDADPLSAENTIQRQPVEPSPLTNTAPVIANNHPQFSEEKENVESEDQEEVLMRKPVFDMANG